MSRIAHNFASLVGQSSRFHTERTTVSRSRNVRWVLAVGVPADAARKAPRESGVPLQQEVTELLDERVAEKLTGPR